MYALGQRNERPYGPVVQVLVAVEIFRGYIHTSWLEILLNQLGTFVNHGFYLLKEWPSSVQTSDPVDREAELLLSPLSGKSAGVCSKRMPSAVKVILAESLS